jgi:hypothetical protein
VVKLNARTIMDNQEIAPATAPMDQQFQLGRPKVVSVLQRLQDSLEWARAKRLGASFRTLDARPN